jgi:hypothetical protein
MHLSERISVVVFSCLAAITVHADPVTWTLTDAVFDDGGTATGSFTYDRDTNTLSDINIVTSATATATGASYTALLSGGPTTTRFVQQLQADYTGARVLSLNYDGSLTNAGGTVPIGTAFSAEALCTSSTCNSEAPQRRFVAGSVVAGPPPVSVGVQLPKVAIIDDIDDSGEYEVVVMGRRSPAEFGAAGVWGLQSSDQLNGFWYSEAFPASDASPIGDINGNETMDIAFLVFDPVNERPKIEVHEPLDGKRIKNVNFNKDHAPVALSIIADQNGNQSQEAAVLARRISDGRGRLLIRDLVTKAKVTNISLPKIYTVLSLDTADDISGNGAPEALVLATRNSDQVGFVLIWDTGGAGKIVNVRLPKNHDPVDHLAISGPGGISAVAVLALRTTDNRGRLLVYDALTGAKLWGATLATGRVPVSVVPVVTSGGEQQLAALQRRNSDIRPVVTFYDVDSGGLVKHVFFDADQFPLALAALPDSVIDAGSDPELAVFVFDIPNQVARTRVRDSVSKQLIQTLELPPLPP